MSFEYALIRTFSLQIAYLYFGKVEPAMDKVIEDFYKKHLHPDHLLPGNLRSISQYMTSNGFDIHTMPHPPGAQKATLQSTVDRIEDAVRFSTITTHAADNPLGLRLNVSHFETSLLRDVLIAAIAVFLTECPHLRTLFGSNRRIPRSSLAMPALRVRPRGLITVFHDIYLFLLLRYTFTGDRVRPATSGHELSMTLRSNDGGLSCGSSINYGTARRQGLWLIEWR